MEKCVNCGMEIETGAAFCPNCGAGIEAAAIENANAEPEAAEAAAEVDAEVAEIEAPAVEAAAAENAGVEAAAAAETGKPEVAAETFEGPAVESEEDAEAAEGSEEDIDAEVAGDAEDIDAEAAEGGEEDIDTEAVEEEIDEDEEKQPVRNDRWTWVTTLVVVIAALIIMGLIGYMGYTDGWLKELLPKAKASYTMGDYSTIEVLQSEVEVTDDYMDSWIEYLLENDVDEDGNIPELTDEWCKEYSSENFEEVCETEEAFRAYLYDVKYTSDLHSAMLEYLESLITIKAYDEKNEAALVEYYAEALESTASQYGVTADQFAAEYGYNSALEYETELARDVLKTAMVIDKILADEKLTLSQEEIDEKVEELLLVNGIESSAEEYREQTGDGWMLIVETTYIKSDIALEAIEDHVKFVEETPAE